MRITAPGRPTSGGNPGRLFVWFSGVGFLGNEIKSGGVDAVAKTGGSRTIVEEMAEMTMTSAAVNLGPGHEPTAILLGFYVGGIDRLPVTGPTGSRIKLGLRGEQRESAADAVVDAFFLEIPVGTGKGAFRSVFAGDAKLFGAQSNPPFFVGSANLVRHEDYLRSARVFLIRLGT